MRHRLEPYEHRELTFIAKVGRFGTRRCNFLPNVKIATIMLVDVREKTSNRTLAQHVWFDVGDLWEDLYVGDTVHFKATVRQYRKRNLVEKQRLWYQPTVRDYTLTDPKDIVRWGSFKYLPKHFLNQLYSS